MQELMHLVVCTSLDDINHVKQIFLTVVKSYDYAVHGTPKTTYFHIAKVLFHRGVQCFACKIINKYFVHMLGNHQGKKKISTTFMWSTYYFQTLLLDLCTRHDFYAIWQHSCPSGKSVAALRSTWMRQLREGIHIHCTTNPTKHGCTLLAEMWHQ